MEVRCERCRAAYAVDEARVPDPGVKVACPGCGHGFLLRKRVLAVAVPLRAGDGDATVPVTDLAPPADGSSAAAPRGEWRLRQPSGQVFPFRELSTLQRWIVERKASRDDEVASGTEGADWRKLGEIPELRSFFALVDRASRAPDPRRDAVDLRGSPGTEDPAWARDPAPQPRRTTGSLPAVPRSRPRLVWVALLALGLVAVSAVIVYLRRKAEADEAARAVATAAAQAVPYPAPVRPAQAPPALVAPAAVAVPAPSVDPGPAAPSGPSAASGPAASPGPASPTGPEPTPGSAPETAPAKVPATVATPETPAPAPPAPPAARPPAREDPKAALQSTLSRARAQRERGRCEEALRLYAGVLAQDGRNAAALAGRGACYLDLSQYAQAEASFVGALDSDPRNADALFGLAETYRYLGRNAEAITAYQRLLAAHPTGEYAAEARRLSRQLKE